jgi:hypothetical protein
MPVAAHKTKLQITTVRLPKHLYEEARAVVAKGATEAKSLNDLLVDSLAKRLKQLRRQCIDAEFARMKGDVRYQQEAVALAEQFAASDWEALRLAEGEKS